jgi:predicted outer membrane repeat protein
MQTSFGSVRSEGNVSDGSAGHLSERLFCRAASMLSFVRNYRFHGHPRRGYGARQGVFRPTSILEVKTMGGLTHSKRNGLWVVFVVLLSGLSVGVTLLLGGGQTARADPGVIYVDAAATGAANGESWDDAYTSVQDALGAAGSSDEIWVAAGTYEPTSGTDRSATFQLASGVEIYGGFAGTETGREERDWETNETILSGDIGNPGDSGDNSYHVVTGSGTDATAVLDGFTITGGHAEGANYTGGGMLNDGGSPTLRNVTFEQNQATHDGGGIYNENGSSPTLINCEFTNNVADSDDYGGEDAGDGGGMYNDLNSSPVLSGTHFVGNTAYCGGGMHNENGSNPRLTDVTFSGNSAHGGDGGGMHNYPASSPVLTNVTFIGNTATVDGGGMANGDNSNPTLTNVTFSGNSADRYGGGIYSWQSEPTLTNVTFSGNHAGNSGGGVCNSSSSPTLVNCILWGNTASTAGYEIYNISSSPTISYTDIQGGCDAIDGNVCGEGNINADPLFVDGADGDLRLQLASPAIDAGDNEAPGLAGITTDLGGHPRFADVLSVSDSGNGDPPIVDMGAYEAPPELIFVDVDAIGADNGSSWADAFTDLQDALTWAVEGVEIWVAAGVYTPDEGAGQTDGDRESTFTLEPGVALYGGFAGTEDERVQRDWTTNVTVLSGDVDGDDGTDADGVVTDTANIAGTNAYHVVTGDGVTETAVLDGFTITAGCADGAEWPEYEGGGMLNEDSSPTLANLTFSGNQAKFSGGGMLNWYGSPTLTDVTFSGNTASSGGGMYDFYGSSTLTNVTFSGNESNSSGGGMINWYSSSTLTDVTFSGNRANSYGGGMYNRDNSSPTLTNVTFSGNTANNGGGMCNRDNSSPALTNVTFSGNQANSWGGGMYNSQSSPMLTNVALIGNDAEESGGGMYNSDNSSPALTDVTFSSNQADSGGGIYNSDNSSPVLTNVTLSGNQAHSFGGGMYNSQSSPTLTNVALIGNHAETFGGGIHNWAGSPTLTNVALSGNQANAGGGMYNSFSSPALVNAILWGNSPNNILSDTNSNPTITYSDIEGGYAGEGNINADPLFVAPVAASEAPTTTGDYRLTEGSAAIDAGLNAAVPITVTTDLDGNPRIVDGNEDGSEVVDMGAYEFRRSKVYLPLVVRNY